MNTRQPGIIDYDPKKIAISELESQVETIERNYLLRDQKNFNNRVDAIDLIEFQIVDQIEHLLQETDQPDQLISLKYRAEKIKSVLEEININLFQKLRTNIRSGKYSGIEFKDLINEYFDFLPDEKAHAEEPGYDNLDIFINGLFSLQAIPQQTKELEPEMVYYQKTPARIIFELVEKSQFIKEDIFFDIGSGLGQAAILVNFLGGIEVRGVEFEPAFCEYANDCTRELNLSNVTFINVDARNADYSEGTIFFMFTPFKGKILQEVLEILRKESLQRKIKIITYGPCTAQVAAQNWLNFETPKDDNIYTLSFFGSASEKIQKIR